MLCLSDSIRQDDPAVQQLLRTIEEAHTLTQLILAIWPSLNFSQFVEGGHWCLWTREGREEAYVFAGDALCHREKMHRISASIDALQTAIN